MLKKENPQVFTLIRHDGKLVCEAYKNKSAVKR